MYPASIYLFKANNGSAIIMYLPAGYGLMVEIMKKINPLFFISVIHIDHLLSS